MHIRNYKAYHSILFKISTLYLENMPNLKCYILLSNKYGNIFLITSIFLYCRKQILKAIPVKIVLSPAVKCQETIGKNNNWKRSNLATKSIKKEPPNKPTKTSCKKW